MDNLDFSDQEIAGMYKSALTADDHSPAFDLLRLVIHSGMIKKQKKNTSNVEGILNTWQDRYKQFLSEDIPEAAKIFVMKMSDMLTNNIDSVDIIKDFR